MITPPPLSYIIKLPNGHDEDNHMITVTISSDYYLAYISIDNGDLPRRFTKEDIYVALRAKNVVFGIDEDVIDELVRENKGVYQRIIATGIPHESGIDGRIEVLANIKDNSKHFEGDGFKVNFKERSYAVSIRKGDVIARVIDSTQGKEGKTVTGKTIHPRAGKEVRLKKGKNVELSENEKEVYSMVDGTLETENGIFSVKESLTINGDVGIRTGNIKFVGKVIITGSVQSGYIIESEDDVEISGGVEDAIIKCNNLTVWQGVQGSDNTLLEVKGNLDVKFMSNCTAIVGGDIESGSMLNCRIRCSGNINVKGKIPIIVGGEIEAQKNITAGSIGSETGANTTIRAGSGQEIAEKMNRLMEDIDVNADKLKKVEQILSLLKPHLDANMATPEMTEKYKTALNTYKELKEQIGSANEELKELNILADELQNSQIRARLLYVGTKVRIGNSVYIPKEDFRDVIVAKEGGMIIVKPL